MFACPKFCPDLSPSDFYLLTNIKMKLRGQPFSTTDVDEAYRTLVSEVSTSEWHKYFENWFSRMNKCITSKGSYFEME